MVNFPCTLQLTTTPTELTHSELAYIIFKLTAYAPVVVYYCNVVVLLSIKKSTQWDISVHIGMESS